MTTKTFQAETIIEALQKVQEEMGPDAVVVSARDVPIGPAWQVWKKPGVEVISISPDEMQKSSHKDPETRQPPRIIRPNRDGTGVEFVEERPSIEWENNLPAERQARPERPKTNAAPALPRPDGNNQEELWKPRHFHKEDVQGLNQLLAGRSHELESGKRVEVAQSRPVVSNSPRTIDPVKADACPRALRRQLDKLKLQGLDASHIDQLEGLTLKSCSPATLEDETRVKEFLVSMMAANLPVRRWPATEVPARVMIFVGLSGSGKTNALAKVAIFYGNLIGKKVVWVCADTIKTGAIAEARAYSEILNIPMELAYTAQDLRSAIDRHEDADLILVDTPGFNPYAEDQEVELGALLTEIPTAQIFLVTSATAKETESLHCYDSLKFFGLKGSVISKLDEATIYGSVLNFTHKSCLPLTFFTSSRKVSTGLKVANADLLVEALFNGRY